MKKLKAKVPNSKASRQGARLCPPGTIASSFKEKQLKKIQERRRLILQDEEDEAHESQSTRQHQGTKQIVVIVKSVEICRKYSSFILVCISFILVCRMT